MQIVKKGLKKERNLQRKLARVLAFHYGFDSSGDATTRLDLLKAQRKQNEQHDTKAKATQLNVGDRSETICKELMFSFLLNGRIRRCHIRR